MPLSWSYVNGPRASRRCISVRVTKLTFRTQLERTARQKRKPKYLRKTTKIWSDTDVFSPRKLLRNWTILFLLVKESKEIKHIERARAAYAQSVMHTTGYLSWSKLFGSLTRARDVCDTQTPPTVASHSITRASFRVSCFSPARAISMELEFM